MSVEALAIVLNHSRATGTDKVVLLGIANHDGDGGAWPSIATLARYANVDERTVQRSLRKLEEAGEVAVHYNAGGTAQTRPDQRTNRYDILVCCPADCDRTTQHRRTPVAVQEDSGSPTGMERGDAYVTGGDDAHVTSRGDTSVTGEVTPTSPEPSYNHPFNRPSEPSVHSAPSSSSPVGSSSSVAAFDVVDDGDDDWTTDDDAGDEEQPPSAGSEEEAPFTITLGKPTQEQYQHFAAVVEGTDLTGMEPAEAVARYGEWWTRNTGFPLADWQAQNVRARVRTCNLLAKRVAS